MNEKEIERLLKTYGDSVPPCDIPPLPVRKPLRWPRYAAAGFATAAVAGIAIVGLWPQDAVATRAARIHDALSDAKTMEYVMSMKLPSGWHPYLHAYYENGVWRYDTQLNTNLERTIVNRDGMQLIDFKRMDHATLDLAPPRSRSDSDSGQDDWRTALDFAKRSIDFGQTDIKRSVVVRDHAPVDGRPTYEISFKRDADHYDASLIVDKATNLPIESSVVADDQRPNFGDQKQQVHTEFSFNKPLDPQLFSLDPKRRKVIRLTDARDRLKSLWRTPIGSVSGAELRAATITRDGTLWLAVTSTDGEKPMLPFMVESYSGRRYVRASDTSPSQSGTDSFDQIFGKPIYVTAFAPLPMGISPAGALIRRVPSLGSEPVSIDFSRHDPSYVDPGRLLDKHFQRGFVPLAGNPLESLSVTPDRENGDLPSYFALLGLDRPTFSLSQGIWRAKAQALEADKAYGQAAEAYGQLAKARYDWVKYSAFEPMLDAARCYQAIGETRRAEVLIKQAEALKASRER